MLCDGCEETLGVLENEPACYLCGARKGAGGGCPHCRGKGIPHYDQVLRLCRFDEPMKELIHHAKFGRQWWCAEQLADRLLKRPAIQAALECCDAIVPVPLHRWRSFSRGFNQAGVIADRLARYAKAPVVRPLVRARMTQPQTAIHKPARRQANVRGAFRVIAPDAVAGKRIAVVDDVRTTGATLGEVARMLRQCGPVSMTAIVLCVADHRGRGFERAFVPAETAAEEGA